MKVYVRIFLVYAILNLFGNLLICKTYKKKIKHRKTKIKISRIKSLNKQLPLTFQMLKSAIPYDHINTKNLHKYVTSKNFIVEDYLLIQIHLNNILYNLFVDSGSHVSWIRPYDKYAQNKFHQINYAIGSVRGAITKNHQNGILNNFHYLSNVQTIIKQIKNLNGILALGPNDQLNVFNFLDTLRINKVIQKRYFLIEKDKTKNNSFYLKFNANFNLNNFIDFAINNDNNKNIFWNFKIEEIIISDFNLSHKISNIRNNFVKRDYDVTIDTGTSQISAPYNLCQSFKPTIVDNNPTICGMFNYPEKLICGFVCNDINNNFINNFKHFQIGFLKNKKSFILNSKKLFKHLPQLKVYLFQIIFGNSNNQLILGLPFLEQNDIILNIDDKVIGIKNN